MEATKVLKIIPVLMILYIFSGCSYIFSSDITDLEIYPVESRVASGYSADYNATATFKDFSKEEITARVNWSSDDTSVAEVDRKGVVTGKNPGSAVITAEHMGVSRSVKVEVTRAFLESIQVTPINPDLAEGVRRQFKAVGRFSDGSIQNLTSQAEWKSGDKSVAVVRDIHGSKGTVIVNNSGIAVITASVEGITGRSVIRSAWTSLESIQVTPHSPKSSAGFTQQFKAVGIYTNKMTQDLTDQVRWTSSASSVAEISNSGGSEGLASAKSSGRAAITASFKGVTGNTMFNVTSAELESIQVTPVNKEKPAGLHEKFQATGIFSDGTRQKITSDVIWSIGNPDQDSPVAVVSNRKGHEGIVRAVKPGRVYVRAVKPGSGFMSEDKEGSMIFTVK